MSSTNVHSSLPTDKARRLALGQLVVDLGLIESEDLACVLSIASETSLPVGRVLIMSNYISELDLKNVLRCQTLLREGLINMEQAKRAMDFAHNSKEQFDEALYRQGWNPISSEGITQLGDLLLSANFITSQHLTQALGQCKKTGLPLGRILVLSGVLTEALLTTAVNAQILVRDKKLEKGQAVEALKHAFRRQEPLETTLKEKGFYDLPNRSCPRLGELLTGSGIINDTELVNALEISLTSRKPIGETLIESKIITRQILESTLKIQRMIAEGRIGLTEAKAVLIAVKEGHTLEDALQSKGKQKAETQKTSPSLVGLLKMLGCIDDAAIAQAFVVAQNNSQVISQVLLIGGVIDESSLRKAERCRQMVEAGRLTLEHAGIVFDYSQRRNIDIATALKELQWQHGDEKAEPKKSILPTLKYSNSEFLDLRESAAKLVAIGSYGAARELLNKLAASVKEVTEDDRYSECLDAIAETYMLEQDLHGAEDYYKSSLDHKLHKYGPDNLVVAFAINNMGKVSYFQKHYEEAENFAKEYIRICAAALGANHPHVACGWQNIATIYHIQNKYQHAEHAYKLATAICVESLGESHPTTVRLQKNYDNLLESTNKIAGTRELDSSIQRIISGNWRAIEAPIDQISPDRDSDAT